MILGKLLQRQLRRHWGLAQPEALGALLSALAELGRQDGVAAPLQPVLQGMGGLLAQMDESYAQMERDLALARRSLELSSTELTTANDKLRQESAQVQRSVSSLRHTVEQLTDGLGLPTTADAPVAHPESDLESIAQRLAVLVRAHEQSRQALHTSEQRLALAVQGAHVGLWDWDLRNDHVHYSEEWAAILGYEVDELAPTSATLMDLLVPEDRKSLSQEVGRYFEARRTDTFRHEVRMNHKKGGVCWVEFSGRVVEYDGGEPVRATGVSLDISARKAYEQAMAEARDAAEAASRAKGDFLANMSHEIRTPMNGILGITELCLSTTLDDEQRQYMEMVHASARSLLGVINDILDFSKIEANKLEIEHIPLHLPQVLRHALNPLTLKARAQGLQLETDIGADVPEWLLGDPGRLRQVLLNLVGNAVKFTEAGSVTVSIRCQRPPPGPGGHVPVRFGVKDTGIGIAPERLATVFDAFSQADTSITRRYGGTGLGLTISARLVHLMGGELRVHSRLHEGAEFWFELPLEVAQAPELEGTDPVTDLPSGLRVLVAEDHPVNQVVARKVLEHLGQQVTVVANGQLAVEACEQQRFDLVFMDIQMPVLDGFAATRRIRMHELSQGVRTPILAMTAHAMEGYRERCVAGGMDGFVTKPVDRKQLVQEMKRVLLSPRRAPEAAR
jgi:PAS domain S-box-containing protein